MPACPHDLRDYLFGELTPSQRAEVERYLETSDEAREELEQLKLTHRALLSVPEEEIPRRIAFVSDKVFEPSAGMRLWREFWGAAPRVAFGLAAVLVAVFGGLWLTQPTLTADEVGWRVAFGQSTAAPEPAPLPAGLTREQARQVALEIITERQEEQRAQLARLIAEGQSAPAVLKADLDRTQLEIQEVRQDVSDSYRLIRHDIDNLFRAVGQQPDLALLQR